MKLGEAWKPGGEPFCNGGGHYCKMATPTGSLVWSLMGALWEHLLSLDQSKKWAWYGASEEPCGSLYGAKTSPIRGLVWSFRGAFLELLWSLAQSHRDLGMEPLECRPPVVICLGSWPASAAPLKVVSLVWRKPQRSLAGAFLEPRPVPPRAWYRASEEPFGSLYGA